MPEVLTSNLSTNTSAEENRNSALINLASITGIGGLSYYAATKYGQAGSPIADAYQNLLGTDYLNRHLDKSKTWIDSQGHIFMPQSVKRSMLSQLMALEEASPLHILRTLQLSNIVSPFSDLTSNDQQVLFSSRKLKNQQHYYESLIRFANKDMEDKLKAVKVEEALRNGMIYQNGKMFGIKDGKADLSNVIIKDARLSLAGTKIGSVVSPNQMHSNFAKTVGSTFDLDRVGDDYLSIVGGKDLKNFSNKWGQSWLRYSVEMGMKSLDNPLAGFEEMLRGVGVDQTSFFETKTWNILKKYTNVQLGTGGDYDLSIKKSLLVSGKNVAIKSTKVALGYEIADSVLRTLSPEGGLFNDGIYTGLTNLYASSRVKFAEVWSDKFQGYKDSQENNAEGSTSLTTLMVLPMAGALFGSQVAYLKRMGKTLTTNSEEAGKIYNTAAKSELLSAVGLNKDYKPMKRNALIGALAGATLAAPFLPGALIGDSSKELKERYSGEKEVAQKANRWWLFGGTAWEGSHTQYFAQDKVARIRADSTDKVRYGDDDTKKRLNPLLHPLAYLRDPYKYEKMHEKDMPYPVWGMDVSYGSIYGKIFERTIGQVIKPDIINPAIYDLDDITPSTGKLGLIKRLLIGDKESRSGTIQVPHSVSPDDRGLINAGILAPEASAGYDPKLESAGLVYQAGTDLIGLKGWTASLPLSAIGIDPGNIRPQLSRSGEATSAARDLVDTNMGDLFGFGEFQRKILGTSSGSLAERENPMKNNMAYWLPSKDNQYYINFAKGNPYSKIKNGEDRLPGAGYQSLHPNEIKEGTDPNDYALIHRYKILADVAKGSREHIRAKQQLIEAYQKGDLSKYEENILTTTMEQEKSRDQRKTFYEDKSTRERVTLGPVGFLQSLLWDNIARHGESPTEMLTPIRPMAKFMHKRTAIQDYVETQLGGSDAAIWTNPYSHFIKPALNKTRLIAQGDFKATEVKDKENINEFFDKLGHIRNRANGSPSDDSNSVVASSLSGLNTKEKVLKFKKSLSDDEKDYFESFSKETDEGKRDKIRSILPKDVLRGYEQIWQNIDTARKARSQGVSVQQAIAEDTDKRTTTLSKAFNVKLSNSEKNAIKLKVSKDKDDYVDLGYSTRERIRMSQNDQLRLKMADKEAMTYVDRATGIPNKKFIGWDPRLKTDDIKIRTLSVGGEDLKRFGFWKSDEERMNRIPILKSDEQIVQNLDKIKSDIRNNIKMRQQIEQALFGSGFKSSRIDLTSSPIGNLQIEER